MPTRGEGRKSSSICHTVSFPQMKEELHPELLAIEEQMTSVGSLDLRQMHFVGAISCTKME